MPVTENNDDDYPRNERRRLVRVSDAPAESGIKLNNIISSLLLGVMAWVGVNIERMRDDISVIRETTKVNSVEIINLKKQLSDHVETYHSQRQKGE